MAKSGATGFARIIYAGGYSLQGLRACFRYEAAFRQELVLFIITIPVAFYCAESMSDSLLLMAAVLLVLVVELLNSAIENVVDRIGDEHHELAGRAKDMGSAAVLLSIIIAIIIWLALLL